MQINTSAASPVESGKVCTTPGYVAGVGDPPPDLSGTQPGNSIADGDNGVSVTCRVTGGNEVTFRGDLSGPNVLDPNGRFGVSLHIDGVLKADGTGTASVSMYTSQVGSLNNDPAQPCTLEGVVTNDKQNWGSGVIWAQFSCNRMVNGSSPGTLCGTSGTIVLENCEE
jgi:hypothetical protein